MSNDLRVESAVLQAVYDDFAAAAGLVCEGPVTDSSSLGSAVVESAFTRVDQIVVWVLDALRTSATDAAQGASVTDQTLTAADRGLMRAVA